VVQWRSTLNAARSEGTLLERPNGIEDHCVWPIIDCSAIKTHKLRTYTERPIRRTSYHTGNHFRQFSFRLQGVRIRTGWESAAVLGYKGNLGTNSLLPGTWRSYKLSLRPRDDDKDPSVVGCI